MFEALIKTTDIVSLSSLILPLCLSPTPHPYVSLFVSLVSAPVPDICIMRLVFPPRHHPPLYALAFTLHKTHPQLVPRTLIAHA